MIDPPTKSHRKLCTCGADPEAHMLRTSFKLLADQTRAYGYKNRKQESNAELVGRALRTFHAENEAFHQGIIKMGGTISDQQCEIDRLRGEVADITKDRDEMRRLVGLHMDQKHQARRDHKNDWDMLQEVIAKLHRKVAAFKTALRVNGLRSGSTHEEVDEVINRIEKEHS